MSSFIKQTHAIVTAYILFASDNVYFILHADLEYKWNFNKITFAGIRFSYQSYASELAPNPFKAYGQSINNTVSKGENLEYQTLQTVENGSLKHKIVNATPCLPHTCVASICKFRDCGI